MTWASCVIRLPLSVLTHLSFTQQVKQVTHRIHDIDEIRETAKGLSHQTCLALLSVINKLRG